VGLGNGVVNEAISDVSKAFWLVAWMECSAKLGDDTLQSSSDTVVSVGSQALEWSHQRAMFSYSR